MANKSNLKGKSNGGKKRIISVAIALLSVFLLFTSCDPEPRYIIEDSDYIEPEIRTLSFNITVYNDTTDSFVIDRIVPRIDIGGNYKNEYDQAAYTKYTTATMGSTNWIAQKNGNSFEYGRGYYANSSRVHDNEGTYTVNRTIDPGESAQISGSVQYEYYPEGHACFEVNGTPHIGIDCHAGDNWTPTIAIYNEQLQNMKVHEEDVSSPELDYRVWYEFNNEGWYRCRHYSGTPNNCNSSDYTSTWGNEPSISPRCSTDKAFLDSPNAVLRLKKHPRWSSSEYLLTCTAAQ